MGKVCTIMFLTYFCWVIKQIKHLKWKKKKK